MNQVARGPHEANAVSLMRSAEHCSAATVAAVIGLGRALDELTARLDALEVKPPVARVTFPSDCEAAS